jgi:hypothetical protein
MYASVELLRYPKSYDLPVISGGCLKQKPTRSRMSNTDYVLFNVYYPELLFAIAATALQIQE